MLIPRGCDPKVVVDVVIQSAGGIDQPRDWDDILLRLHEKRGYEEIDEDMARGILGSVLPYDREVGHANA